MKIDIVNVVYTVAMILLAFTAALVVTKTIGKYTTKKENNDENDS